jgi:MFS family permease
MDYNIYNFALPMILDDLKISIPTAGLIFFLSSQGIFLGSLVLPIVADYIGRLKTMIFNVLLFSLGTVAIPFAGTAAHLVIARFVVTGAVGGEQPVGASYVAEEWPPKTRARALAFMQSGAAIGTLLASLLVALLAARAGWQVLFFIGVAPALMVLVLRFWMPESKRWLNDKEDREQGAKVVHADEESRFTLAQLFTPGLRKATLVGTLLLVLGNSASGGIFAWFPTFLAVERGLDISTVGWFGTILAVGMFLGYNAFGWAADALGRKKSFALTFSLGIVSIVVFSMVTNLALLGVATFVTGFSLASMFAGYVIYLTELFPTRARATGTGFCMGVGLFFWGLIPYVMSLVAPEGDFSLSFVIIGAGALVLSLVVILFAQETRGKVLA